MSVKLGSRFLPPEHRFQGEQAKPHQETQNSFNPYPPMQSCDSDQPGRVICHSIVNGKNVATGPILGNNLRMPV